MNTLPHITTGQRIGLLGGSFDPPHEGHVHITLEALRRFHLDAVWWLVSPGNPLKSNRPADFAERLAASNALMRHPKVKVTDIEQHFGTRHTAKTLLQIRKRYQTGRFVWLMGADNMISFHRWQNWRAIAQMMPIGVLARPDAQVKAGLSLAARSLARHRLPQAYSRSLPASQAPKWCMLTGPMVYQSSTAIRAEKS